MEALSGSLSRAGASLSGLDATTKSVNLTYDPNKITVHQLAQAVLETEPVHGKPYQAGLIVTLDDPKSESKVVAALRRVKGLGGADKLPDPQPGEIVILFSPLSRQARPNDFVKASQIAEALEKAGIKVASGLPAPSQAGSGLDDPNAKKKVPGAKGSTKSKSGDEEMPAEKSKPTRPATGASKPKIPREPTTPKSKDGTPEDVPRFQIQAAAGDKVYLVDHEAKLKKFVKQGDSFGDFVVKEAANRDGWYIVLENAETKETIRVEKDPKAKHNEEQEATGDTSKKEAVPKKDSQPAPPAKSKPSPPADLPRFQILGEAGGKVYLADNDAKIKKFVKEGDMFGDFVVKEVGDQDESFVILENAKAKETIRVVGEKKDGDKSKAKSEKKPES